MEELVSAKHNKELEAKEKVIKRTDRIINSPAQTYILQHNYISFMNKMSTTVVFKRQRVIFDQLSDNNYFEYIHSEEWKEKVREAAIEHDYICQLCFRDVRVSGGGTLHHISYEDLYNEQGRHEIFVCNNDCHIYR